LTHKVDQVKITNVYPLVNAQIGTPYSALLNAIGGSSPYSWTVALGGLPDGLLLGNDGTISSTPTGGPGGIFVARVTDSSDPDDTVTKMFEIDIAGAACVARPTRRGDPCGNAPGISSVYPDEASAGATGQSVTVYGCYNTDENDSVGTLTINLPSNFTRTTGPVTTDRSVQELVNIASDAQLGTNQISVHQSLDGCEWNTNQLPYYVLPSGCPSTISIKSKTQKSLPDYDHPDWLTGVGMLARMEVGPEGQDYTGVALVETVTPTYNDCPSTIAEYTSFPTIHAGDTAPFIVGSGAQWEGSDYPSVLNEYYDSHKLLVNINVLGLTNVDSCVAKATQTYSCGGSVVGTFTLTNTYRKGTLNGTQVTTITTDKQAQ
jgi:hypothetical protein